MKDLQNRMNKLRPFVTRMDFVKEYVIVETIFKPKWVVAKHDVIGQENHKENSYRFFSSEDKYGIDEILDFIEEIINVNLEREQKILLLKDKVETLKVLFNQKSLEELKRLDFIIPEPDMVDDLQWPDLSGTRPENNKEEVVDEKAKEEPKEDQVDEVVEENKTTDEASMVGYSEDGHEGVPA